MYGKLTINNKEYIGVLTGNFANLLRIFLCKYGNEDIARLLIDRNGINYWVYGRYYKKLTSDNPRVNYLNYEITRDLDRECGGVSTGLVLWLSEDYVEPTPSMTSLPSYALRVLLTQEIMTVSGNKTELNYLGTVISNSAYTFKLAGIHYVVLRENTCDTQEILLDVFDISDLNVSLNEVLNVKYTLVLR